MLGIRFTLALLAVPLAAQSDYCLRKSSPGTIGQPLNVAFSGATGGSVLFMPSTSPGPIPLALICPGDRRTLAIGPELSSLWSAKPVGGGSGAFSLPIPPLAALAGFDLHAQTVTLPGASCIVNKISNNVIARLAVRGRPQRLTAKLVVGRTLGGVTAAGIGCAQGGVLTMGGGQGTLTRARGLASTERYDWLTQTSKAGPPMTSSRALFETVELSANEALLIGGVDAAGNALATCEIYNRRLDSFTATGGMRLPRAGHVAARLPNGEVLVAGGTTILNDAVKALQNAQLSTEIYNPTSRTWRNGPNMPQRLLLAALDELPNGRLLLTGGFLVNVFLGVPIPVGTQKTCRLYDPTGGGRWLNAAAMNKDRAAHQFSTVRLRNGNVFVMGGGFSGPVLTNARPVIEAETYDWRNNRWIAAPNMAIARLAPSATLLANGNVLVAGGAQGTVSAPIATDNAQVFSPSSNTWTRLLKLTDARAGHSAALLPSGAVALFGGQKDTNTSLDSIEIVHF